MDSLTVFGITALYCDPNGDMWIGTEPRGGKPGLIKYDAAKKNFKPVSALPGIIPKDHGYGYKGCFVDWDRRGIKSIQK